MASESIITNMEKAFSFGPMRALAAYLQTWNCSTATIAVDNPANDIASTGTQLFCLNGEMQGAMTADGGADLSGEPPYSAWATSTAYLAIASAATSVTEVTNPGPGGLDHYACILAHTSGATDDEPGVGATWETYWRKMDNWAVTAVGDVIAAGDTKYYLVVGDTGGFLKMFKAYDSNDALSIPAYDPTRYVALAIMTADHSSGASDFVVGTTLQSADSHSATYTQIVGHCFPDFKNLK